MPKEQSDPSRVQRTAAFGITETFANRRRPFSKSYLSCNVCGRGEIGRRIGLKRDLSAPGETQDAELLKFGETFIGKPQMCRRRPELYSDTKQVDEPQLAPEVFGYHLDTLTNRKEEGLFENFARRLCGKEVCPNLVPQTGPTGGGDSKVDTETHPVAESLAEAWFEGLGTQAATGRWGFAFSAKKDWLPKLKSDVAKAVATKRG